MFDLVAQSMRYTYTTPTPTVTAEDVAAAVGGSAVLLTFVCIALVIGLVVYVVMALSQYKLAQRMKMENSWWSWVPILNIFLLAQMAGFETWYGLLGVIISPFVYVFFYKILEKLGKPTWHLVLVVIIPIFYIPYLAFFDKEAK